MITLPYGLYMAESEGLLDTRESKIQNIIKKVRNYPYDTISDTTFYIICEDCGINAVSLTNSEIVRIEQAIKS